MFSDFWIEEFWGKRLRVSKHAAKRFTERSSGHLNDPEETLRLFLILSLPSDSLSPGEITRRIIDNDLKEAEYWDLEDGLRAVTLNEDDYRILVTIERRKR